MEFRAALSRASLLAAVLAAAPGCLVLSLHPAYDDESIVWDPALAGRWQNVEDNASLEIERGEWRSYRIRYAHPIESGELTGYLTAIGTERYLDVMPARGEDHGAFLVPVHAVLRVRLQGDSLELTALSYDWFFERLRGSQGIPRLSAVEDQKENALIVSPTAQLRSWLRSGPGKGAAFGAPATFARTRKP